MDLNGGLILVMVRAFILNTSIMLSTILQHGRYQVTDWSASSGIRY